MAIDADTKLIPSFYVGNRDAYAAQAFIGDLALRLANKMQLTSDGHKPYLEAVEHSFGADIDYAMLVKIYAMRPARAAIAPASAEGPSRLALRVARTRSTSAPAMQSEPASPFARDRVGSRG